MKDFHVGRLFDFYGEILTEKQRDVFDLYYNADLSLAEISEHARITRQGVRDSIKRGEEVLCQMEEKLGLMAQFDRRAQASEEILALCDKLGEILLYTSYRSATEPLLERIRELASQEAQD